MAKEPRSDLPPRPDEEIAAPDPDARKEFDSRQNYKGYKIPRTNPRTGNPMSLPERRAYKKAIDEREVLFRRDPPKDAYGREVIGKPRDPTALQRKAKRYSEQVIGPTFEDLKQTATELPGKIGRGAKAVGEGLIDAATVVPRTKAAIAADPEGAKQFASNVMSGDREAIRSMATEASGGIVEPLATVGDAVLGVMAAQEGKPLEAAGYAGLILVPGVVQTLGKSMSKGWLKSAAEAGKEIPDEAARKLNDLAKRVDEGKVTDDMQIRREIAMVEDAHRLEYMQSVPPVGERKSAFEPFPEYVPSPTGITSDSTKRKIADDVSKVTETSERIKSKLPGGGRSVDDKMLSEISTRDAFGRTSGGRLFKIEDDYIEAADLDDAVRLATDDDGFYHYVFARGIDEPDDIRSVIKEASPEESAKYFDLKRQDPRGIKFLERSRGGTPGGGRSVDAEKMLSGQLEQINKDLDYEYNQLELNTDPESVRLAELSILDLLTKKRQLVDSETRSGRIDKGDIDRFSGELSRSQFKPQDFPDVDLNPDQEDLLNTISELGEKTVGANKYRVTGRFPENPDLIDWFQTKLSLLRGRPSEPGIDRSEYLNALVDTYADIGKNYDDFFRVSGFKDEFSSGKLNDRLSQNYADRIDSGRRIDDLEGPSEAEIRQMVEQGRFGDPEELEMLKEDMRRMAQLEQGAQIGRGRARQSRSPGTPGVSGEIPEGTSRADRKGGKRERPKPKTKKDKYEN